GVQDGGPPHRIGCRSRCGWKPSGTAGGGKLSTAPERVIEQMKPTSWLKCHQPSLAIVIPGSKLVASLKVCEAVCLTFLVQVTISRIAACKSVLAPEIALDTGCIPKRSTKCLERPMRAVQCWFLRRPKVAGRTNHMSSLTQGSRRFAAACLPRSVMTS